MSKVDLNLRLESDWKLIVLGFTMTLFDQTVKFFVTFWDFGYSLNKGVAFSLFENDFRIVLGLNIVGFLILTILMIKVFATKNMTIYKVLMALIFGASLSNLGDRIFRGGVVDFINLPYIPSFNLADMTITFSVILFLILLFVRNDTKLPS